MTSFLSKLLAQWDQGKFLCVGLDTDLKKLPESVTAHCGRGQAVFNYNEDIIQATGDLVCAFKPNIAFYEALGEEGFNTLARTIDYIKSNFHDVPIILDYKRGDIGNTNLGYITTAFDELHADAVTVSPYLGQEAMQPFLDRKDKGIFVLCRTSNPGAGEFQDRLVLDDKGTNTPLYQYVASRVAMHWNTHSNCGLVVGATAPHELEEVRRVPYVDELPILIPGIGAQGGSLKKSVLAGRDSRGRGIIVNASREVLYASSGKDYADAARKVALTRSDEIRDILKSN